MAENKVKGAQGGIAYSQYVFAEFIISGFCIDISAELNAALGLYTTTLPYLVASKTKK